MIRFEVCNCLDSRYSERERPTLSKLQLSQAAAMDKSGMDDECLRSIQESSSLAELVQTILEDCKVA